MLTPVNADFHDSMIVSKMLCGFCGQHKNPNRQENQYPPLKANIFSSLILLNICVLCIHFYAFRIYFYVPTGTETDLNLKLSALEVEQSNKSTTSNNLSSNPNYSKSTDPFKDMETECSVEVQINND